MGAGKTSDSVINVESLNDECRALADWWLQYAVDEQNGGYYGQVSYDNLPVVSAEKCIILNTRILWFFSATARYFNDETYAKAADRAYAFLRDRFHDKTHEGFYWSLTAKGELLDSRKHVYAQAFAVYALAAYYDLRGDEAALALAMNCYDKLEQHARDPEWGGYFEAFACNWDKHKDSRLSQKEANHPKTMNTHLHVLEAYTGLHDTLLSAGKPAREVTLALEYVLKILCEKIVDKDSGHIRMFLTEDWQDKSDAWSFGHDIEASWLIRKAIKSLANAGCDVAQYKEYAGRLACRSITDGLQENGCMHDEVQIQTGLASHTAWWVQMEALAGFAYMWQELGGEHIQLAINRIWQFTLDEYRDYEFGEWHWYGKSDLPFAEAEYKIGAWKAPYHTGRALMEVAKILDECAG